MNFEDVITPEQQRELASAKATAAEAVKQREDLEHKIHQRDEADAIRTLIRESGPWVAPTAESGATELLKKQLRFENGQLTVTSEEGHPIMGDNGMMTPAELVSRFRKTHPNFVHKDRLPTTANENDASNEHLRKIFGRASDSKYAQQFFAANPERYRQLRELAAERGIK